MGSDDWRVAEIIRRCHSGLDAPGLLRDVADRLGHVVPYDSGFFGITDPSTLLFTGGVLVDQEPAVLPRFLANEWVDADVMKFRVLAGGRRRIDWLDRATGGERDLSARYRQLLEPRGMGDELRAVFMDGGTCWGVMCLSRATGSVSFTEQDAQLIGRVSTHVGEGLRTALLLSAGLTADAAPDGPGVLLLSSDLSVVAATPAAERWMHELGNTRDTESFGLPVPVWSAAAAVRSLGSASADAPIQPRVRARTRAGRWLVLHASHLGGDTESPTIAVVLEPAPSADLAPLMLQAYGLTTKESEVARLVLLGQSTKEISGALFISEHTVQDHLKAIFDKTGVGSRRELVALLISPAGTS